MCVLLATQVCCAIIPTDGSLQVSYELVKSFHSIDSRVGPGSILELAERKTKSQNGDLS